MASRVGLSAIPAYLLAGLLLGPNEPKALSIDPALRSDRFRGADRDRLPALLPRPRVHARPNRPQPRLRLLWGSDRRGREWRARAPRRRRRVRAQLRGLHPRRRDLRLLQRGHRQGADRLPPARRRRDRPRARDPRRRGPRDRPDPRLRGAAAAASSTSHPDDRGKAIGFITPALAISKWLSGPIDRFLDWLPREIFLLAAFAFLVGLAASPRSSASPRRSAR